MSGCMQDIAVEWYEVDNSGLPCCPLFSISFFLIFLFIHINLSINILPTHFKIDMYSNFHQNHDVVFVVGKNGLTFNSIQFRRIINILILLILNNRTLCISSFLQAIIFSPFQTVDSNLWSTMNNCKFFSEGFKPQNI